MSYQLPYAHLNLRRNPFGELSVEEWTQLAVVEIEDVLSFLERPRAVVQFVGEKGYGKTTHLLALVARLPRSAYVHIPEGQRVAVPFGHPIAIDEAQRLTLWQRLRLFHSDVPLILGTHVDYARQLAKRRRSVLTVEPARSTTVERVWQLANARIRHVRRNAGQIPSVRMETIEKLMQRFGPDIRAILGELYGQIESLTHICNV